MKRPLLPQIARDIYRAALAAVHAGHLLSGAVSADDQFLRVAVPDGPQLALPLARFRRITVVGAGKATAAMAQALEALLGDRIDRGLIAVKDGHTLPLQRITTVEAGHPLPDKRGRAAARQIMAWLDEAGPDELVIALLTGGASALLPAPVPGVTLAQKQKVTTLLLRAGADIRQLNAVRQHLSAAKGGQLAALACPATVLVLEVSDVIGDDPAIVASGPFTPCPSSYREAIEVLQELGLAAKVPAAVRAHLERGEPALPAPDHPAFRNVHTFMLGTNRLALQAAAARCRVAGLHPLILTSSLQGEARDAARVLAAIAREARHGGSPGPLPLALLAGGETTVTVRGAGKGGRNLEMALAGALALAGEENMVFLAGGTDGTDGPTDAAGAWADGRTAATARSLGLDPRACLDRNDSYPFFKQAGGLLMTGPTWTNVMDLQVLLVG